VTSAGGQLAALLALRWQMVRSGGARLGLLVGVAVLVWLLRVALRSGGLLDSPSLATALEVAPSAYLGFGVLAVIAPLTAGGGNELVPPDQLVAYPVRTSTQFLGGLLLAPVNLVWLVQLLALTALTAFLTLDTSLPRGVVTTAAYVACITVLGQALAWLVVGSRQTRAGRWTVGAAACLLAATAIGTVQTGRGGDVLAASPTHSVVQAVTAGDTAVWARTTGILLGLAVLGLLAGSRVCGWALHRPGDAGSAGRQGPVRRRPAQRSAFRELLAVDRASVWRAPALRRGGLVLAVLPGLLAAAGGIPWESLIVLPGLVAAGAGLLFGINVFCLDGSGAVWLASLPQSPRLAFRVKAVVLTETVLAAVTLAVAAGSLRSTGVPTPAEVSGIAAAGLTCSAVVVAQCLRASVRRPHRADLTGPRDAVAPPGALAVASIRLAVPTALVGLVLAAAAASGTWWLPLACAAPLLLASGLSVGRTVRRYDVPSTRWRLASAAAAG
jgi:hypothetical protein